MRARPIDQPLPNFPRFRLGRLETTTIYTKVAVLRQRQIASPLDTLTGRAPQASPAFSAPSAMPNPPAQRPPVGRLRMDLRLREGEAAADVKLTVLDDDRFIHLPGVVVREPRSGWVTLEVPPLETWEQPLSWLSPEKRERIESPEFYQLLQTHATRKYLALKKSGP